MLSDATRAPHGLNSSKKNTTLGRVGTSLGEATGARLAGARLSDAWRPPLPCPRFAAPMAASDETLASTFDEHAPGMTAGAHEPEITAAQDKYLSQDPFPRKKPPEARVPGKHIITRER